MLLIAELFMSIFDGGGNNVRGPSYLPKGAHSLNKGAQFLADRDSNALFGRFGFSTKNEVIPYILNENSFFVDQ